jgi:hypothetical protein
VRPLAPEHDGQGRTPRARSDDRNLAHAITTIDSLCQPVSA